MGARDENRDVAELVVEAVIANLMRRRGIKQALWEVEERYPETWAELKADLADLVQDILRAGGRP